MNKREESKLTAYNDIINVIDDPGEGIGNEIPSGLNVVKNSLKLICTEINAKEAQLKNSAIGKTEAKDVSMEALIDETVMIAGAVFAYAIGQNNVELEKFANISEGELQRSRETDVPIKVKAILEKADELGAALESYGVTQIERDSLRTKLAEYNERAANQNSGFTSKTAARDDLTALFNKADKDVEVIEKLMKQFEKKHPEFYNRFEAAKNIKNKAVRHRTGEEQQEPAPQNP